MLQLYFIRHGQSTNNVILEEADWDEYLIERESDPDLTSAGKKQAQLVAEFLARPSDSNGFDPQNRVGFGLTHLYCSLMIRAIKTGQAISTATGLPLVARPEVHEIGGIYKVKMENGERVFVSEPGPNKTFFTSEFPELIIPSDLPETGWWDQGKEPRESYQVRARLIIDRLLDEHGGKDHRVGIVTHGGIFARILTALFDLRAESYWFLMNNCGISRVDIRDNGHFILAYMNKVDHLPDHLVT